MRAGPGTSLRRRRVGLVAAVVGVLLGVVAGSTAVHGAVAGRPGAPSASEVAEPIDGYPQRIGFERPSPRLPDRPGPLAATLFDNDFGTGRTLGVTARGRLWELPLGRNALSPDGRLLLTAQWSGKPPRLVVQDLADGSRRVFDDIGQVWDWSQRRAVHYALDQTAGLAWSQDGSAVLVDLQEPGRGHRGHPAVLDVASGTVTELAGASPAGFRSPTQPVTLRTVDPDGPLVATTTDLETGEVHDLTLRTIGPWQGDRTSSVTASVSPDGARLLLLEPGRGRFPDATLRLFSLTDGRELAPRSVEHWDGCDPVWLGADPVLPTRSGVAGAVLITAGSSRPLVAVHHRLQSSCLQLTAAALAAGPHRSLLGTSTALWTWYGWQLLLVAALVLLCGGLLLRRSRPARD